MCVCLSVCLPFYPYVCVCVHLCVHLCISRLRPSTAAPLIYMPTCVIPNNNVVYIIEGPTDGANPDHGTGEPMTVVAISLYNVLHPRGYTLSPQTMALYGL